jgi:hypothetical protein
MERYRNVAGNSGIAAYEIGKDYIVVQFEDGGRYRYTYASSGRENVERMKGLAKAGQGLNTFLSTEVSKLYERKESNPPAGPKPASAE